MTGWNVVHALNSMNDFPDESRNLAKAVLTKEGKTRRTVVKAGASSRIIPVRARRDNLFQCAGILGFMFDTPVPFRGSACMLDA